MRKYIKHFEENCCPHCGSTDYAMIEEDDNNPYYKFQYFRCDKCSSKWYQRYKKKTTYTFEKKDFFL